jgi:predicted phosphoribosyltransferase
VIAMMFQDRIHAAHLLAGALKGYSGTNPLVVAIPRGAVPMAKVIADELQGELDIVMTRKLQAPGSSEFAIGAVDETGWTYLADYAQETGATQEYIAREVGAERETMRRRRAQYTPGQGPFDAEARIVIVVDDGLATGATMIAALHSMRARKPQRLICAVPVASPEAVERVRPYADEVVCLETPDFFYAVSQFYRVFGQVEDDEVIALLKSVPSRRHEKQEA